MSGQPKDMAELVMSVGEVRYTPGAVEIIPTIATRRVEDLGATQRTIAMQGLLNQRASFMNLAAFKPGDEIKVPAQTDCFYRDNDATGAFMRLTSIAANAARGKR